MTDAPTAVSPLRRRMIDDMRLRNLSPATQRSYLHAVTKFSRYFGRSPDRLGLEDVRAFQVHLVSQGISWPALNQTVCALALLLRRDAGPGEIPERIAYARTPRKLPAILSADEVVRFLEAVPSLKARAALTTAYAAGLRASEAVSLKVADIDSDADGDPGPPRQGRQGPHGDAVAAAARHPAHLLAAGAARAHWLFPGRARQADRRAGAPCRLPFRDQGGEVWSSGSVCTRCATALPRICSRAASISGSSRCCSATAACRRQRATPMWRRRRSPRRRARSIA